MNDDKRPLPNVHEMLRGAVQKLRRTSQPLVDYIPLMQKAADELEATKRENMALRTLIRITALRSFPERSHEEITDEINRAIRSQT